MIPRRVKTAILLAFILHGIFILAGRYHLSFDAYTHMLFADHYANNWFSLWETRWYTGFEVNSYPPLTHQLIAIFIPLLGFDKAFAFILWVIATLYPLGIYGFSRIFTGKSASANATMASAALPPIFLAAHVFGQLPFITATLFALFNAAALAKYLREGGLPGLILVVFTTAATMSAHHATLLLQPFLIFAVFIALINKNNFLLISSRLVLYAALAVAASWIVIWPFWQWGLHQEIQTPIDHLSRHNFINDPMGFIIFFFPFYFPIGFSIPFLFKKWSSKFAGLLISFFFLFILGLGGTTPLPQLIFGKGWEWLTYDRFAYWAALLLTPFFGILLIRLNRKWKNRLFPNLIPASLRGTFIPTATWIFLICSAFGVWVTTALYPTQPEQVDMQPIVDFLNEGDNSQWRYLTFGMGNQYTYLNLLTEATTMDGSYHTARTLPELRNSGVGEIDSSFWLTDGMERIAPVLEKSGEHGIRWGFVERRDYVPLLKKQGWIFIKYLPNGIQIWENPKAALPELSEPPNKDPFAEFSWGVFPLLSFIFSLAMTLIIFWKEKGEKILRRLFSLAVGVIPVSLCFWYYKIVGEFPHKFVYFTYDHVLFYLSDAVLLIAILFWLAIRIVAPQKDSRQIFKPLFIFLCWMTLTSFWSLDWRTSAYTSLHFWLIYALIRALGEIPEAWKTVMLGFCAALSIEVFTGITGFTTQSAAFLEPLGLEWPGNLLTAISPGASTVTLPDGIEILRAYGTLPHPNILSGFTLICLTGPIALFLRKEKPNIPALLLICLGSILLALTFSRSAWIAFFIFIASIILKKNLFNNRNIIILVATIAISFTATLIPLHDLFLTRTARHAAQEFSVTGRAWLAEQVFLFTKTHLFQGSGAGTFIIELAEKSNFYNYVEPAHSIPLLILSELGIIGLILAILALFEILKQIRKLTSPNLILGTSLLAGLGFISLFDHYLWTLAPGRVLLGLTLGLFLGQLHPDSTGHGRGGE